MGLFIPAPFAQAGSSLIRMDVPDVESHFQRRSGSGPADCPTLFPCPSPPGGGIATVSG